MNIIESLPEESIEFFNTLGGPLHDVHKLAWHQEKITELPPRNTREYPLEYQLFFKIQGLQKEDFSVEVDKGILTISFEKEMNELDERSYPRVIYSCFSRAFYLPKDAHGDLIKARYSNGVLQVRIPKLRPCDEKALHRKALEEAEAVLEERL